MISVCMATYNGARYIDVQLQSILSQLARDDEVIVVDDGSTDATLSIIAQFNDQRISVIQNENNLGPIRSFELAINRAKGDVIFLSDQDDRWHDDKVSQVMRQFTEPAVMLTVHDGIVTNGALEPTANSWNHFNGNHFNDSVIKTLIKNPYTGAMMAFRRELKDLILPFPSGVPMHDWWIGLICLKHHLKIVRLNETLMDYRRHGDNVTGGRRGLGTQLRDRVRMLTMLAGR